MNGKEETVIMCYEDFIDQQKNISELKAKLAIYTHLSQAEDDIKIGRVQDFDDTFTDILSELDTIENEI